MTLFSLWLTIPWRQSSPLGHSTSIPRIGWTRKSWGKESMFGSLWAPDLVLSRQSFLLSHWTHYLLTQVSPFQRLPSPWAYSRPHACSVWHGFPVLARSQFSLQLCPTMTHSPDSARVTQIIYFKNTFAIYLEHCSFLYISIKWHSVNIYLITVQSLTWGRKTRFVHDFLRWEMFHYRH